MHSVRIRSKYIDYSCCLWMFAGDDARSNITDAMRTMEQATSECVHFRPRTSSDRNYLKIQTGEGCKSTVSWVCWKRFNRSCTILCSLLAFQVGYTNWFLRLLFRNHQSTMILGANCFEEPIILHELMHALGKGGILHRLESVKKSSPVPLYKKRKLDLSISWYLKVLITNTQDPIEMTIFKSSCPISDQVCYWDNAVHMIDTLLFLIL